MQEILILAGVSAADRIGLVVDMPRWIMRMNDEAFGVVAIEMKDARFAMIDPDNCVIMTRHDGLQHSIWPTDWSQYQSMFCGFPVRGFAPAQAADAERAVIRGVALDPAQIGSTQIQAYCA
jgi:hypothetical protein